MSTTTTANTFSINSIIEMAKEAVIKACAYIGKVYRSAPVQAVVQGVKDFFEDNWGAIITAGVSVGVASAMVTGIWPAIWVGTSIYAISRTAWAAYHTHANGFKISISNVATHFVLEAFNGFIYTTALSYGVVYGGLYATVALHYAWGLFAQAWAYAAYFLVA